MDWGRPAILEESEREKELALRALPPTVKSLSRNSLLKRGQVAETPTLGCLLPPIVHDAQAENVFFSVIDANRHAELIARPDKETNFSFIIHLSGGPEANGFRKTGSGLSHWTPYLRPTHDDRRRTAVVPDRHVFVVGSQRSPRSKHASDIRRVVNGGIEIGVIANLYRYSNSASGSNQMSPTVLRGFALGKSVARRRLCTRCRSADHSGWPRAINRLSKVDLQASERLGEHSRNSPSLSRPPHLTRNRRPRRTYGAYQCFRAGERSRMEDFELGNPYHPDFAESTRLLVVGS